MVSEIDVTQAVKEFAAERLDIDLFGIAPVDRLEGAPEGRRPTDYLPPPRPRSVLVAQSRYRTQRSIVAGHYDEPGKTLGPYNVVWLCHSDWKLSSAAGRLVSISLSEGLRASPLIHPPD